MKNSVALKLCKRLVEMSIKKEVNSSCRGFFFQPKLPKGMKEKFSK